MNFFRDRAPFVLTSDMAYVINGGDRPSEKFHQFVDLCCQAFNIVRANGNLILYIFTLVSLILIHFGKILSLLLRNCTDDVFGDVWSDHGIRKLSSQGSFASNVEPRSSSLFCKVDREQSEVLVYSVQFLPAQFGAVEVHRGTERRHTFVLRS